MKRKDTRHIRRRIIKIHDCYFCKQKIEPDYKDIETLKHSLSDRGKIIPRLKNGTCQKHQKSVTMGIKRARYLALLPFVVRPS